MFDNYFVYGFWYFNIILRLYGFWFFNIIFIYIIFIQEFLRFVI